MGREDYITTNEAASELGVTRQRVLQLIQDGRIKAEKFANASYRTKKIFEAA